MKKTLLTAALALASMAMSAQTLYLSTYAGTNVAKYDGMAKDITMTRTIFHGWNTISLPFAMSEAQVNEYFGNDCRLEKFVGVETNANATTMLFQDVKAEGIQANTPYILHYTGETKSVKLAMQGVTLLSAPSAISFNDMNGMTITMSGAQTSKDSKGLYGILAKANDEASFVNVDELNTKFYATHCYVTVENIDDAKSTDLTLATRHLAADATAITNVKAAAINSSAVYNIQGQRISDNQKGIQLKNGKKIMK